MSQEEHAELDHLRQEKESLTSAAAVLQRVRTLPEDEALLLFHQLRATGAGNNDASPLVYVHECQDVLLTVPQKRFITTGDIRPPSPLSVEFELMMQHPVLYPVVSTDKNTILHVANATNIPDQEPQDPDDLTSFL